MIDLHRGNLGDGKPFLAWIGYQAVHYPHQAPKEFIDKYDGFMTKVLSPCVPHAWPSRRKWAWSHLRSCWIWI
jgi:hypothetical protein